MTTNMADAEEEFSADGVMKFLLANSGKATNVQVVGHFAKYLNDPELKVLNRQKFKDFINEVATVKSEKGEKYLVLKNEYFYREWIEPKHVIIRSAQSQAPKASWPPPAPEQPMETDPQPVAPTRRKKKSHDHSSAHQDGSSGSGRSSPKPKGSSGSPRPTISAPFYTGPVDQHSVVSKTAGEKEVEELSQIEGVRDARDRFEKESKLQTPSPAKPSSSSSTITTTTTTTTTNDADALPQAEDVPPAPVEIQVTDEDRKGEEIVAMESSEKMEQEPSKEPTPIPPPTQPIPAISQAIAEMQKPEDSPSVKTARKLFEREAEKEAAAAAQLTPKLGANRTPKSGKKLVQNGVSPAHHHEDDDHNLIGSDLAESVSSDTLRSIKSTSSGNSYPDTPAKLEPLERQWMLESAKGNVPVLMELLDQEPGLAAKKDFITGFSALHWGAKHGKKEMIRLVVDRGVDVNMRSQGGYTPLHVAAMHNKEAIMQFLVSEYRADINKRDFSGRKPRHYLQSSSSNYIKQMMLGQSTAEVIQPHTLISLAEPKQEEKRHSKFGNLLRSSFRNSFRLWGSAENLEDKDHKRDRTPPVTPPPSPKTRPKSSHPVNYSQSLLMPPPSGYTVPSRSRKLRSTSDKDRVDQMRKSESDPDMLVETTPTTFV